MKMKAARGWLALSLLIAAFAPLAPGNSVVWYSYYAPKEASFPFESSLEFYTLTVD